MRHMTTTQGTTTPQHRFGIHSRDTAGEVTIWPSVPLWSTRTSSPRTRDESVGFKPRTRDRPAAAKLGSFCASYLLIWLYTLSSPLPNLARGPDLLTVQNDMRLFLDRLIYWIGPVPSGWAVGEIWQALDGRRGGRGPGR